MANGAVTEIRISASTQVFNSPGFAMCARLFSSSAWIATTTNADQWLQVDFGQKQVKVTRVATQGRYNVDEWVATYKLQYGSNGVIFTYFKQQGQTSDKVKSYP